MSGRIPFVRLTGSPLTGIGCAGWRVAGCRPQKLPQDLREWVAARRRFRLTHAQVQMARELGLNPGKLGKIANHAQEAWKAPLPAYVAGLYFKRFKHGAPEVARSIEELDGARRLKKAAASARTAGRRAPDGIAANLNSEWMAARRVLLVRTLFPRTRGHGTPSLIGSSLG